MGVAASIRIVNPQSMTKADFVDGGSATDEMLDFLAACLRYGISICVAGATSYFFHYELPKLAAWLRVVENRDMTCVRLPEAAF